MGEIWGVPRLPTCAILLSLASRCADHWWQRSSSSPWKPVNWQKAQVPLRLTESSPCPKTGFSPMPSDAPADADASVTGRKRLEPRAKFHGQRVTGDDGSRSEIRTRPRPLSQSLASASRAQHQSERSHMSRLLVSLLIGGSYSWVSPLLRSASHQ